MKKISINLLLTLSFLLHAACNSENKKSDTLKPDDIYQHYDISFYQGTGLFKVSAKFLTGAKGDRLESEKTGGDAVELTSPASVTYNGEEMKFNSGFITGCYYQYEKMDVFDTDYKFVWKDNLGKVYENFASMESVKIINLPEALNSTDDITVHWDKPVAENEKVTIRFTKDKEYEMESSSAAGSTSIHFSSGALKNVSGKAVKVEITKKLHVPLQHFTKEGGFIDVSYHAQTLYMDIYKGIINTY